MGTNFAKHIDHNMIGKVTNYFILLQQIPIFQNPKFLKNLVKSQSGRNEMTNLLAPIP